MFDFMQKLVPVASLLKMVANQITQQTGHVCDKFDIVYDALKDELTFITIENGQTVRHGYEDKSVVGKFIKTQALNKLKDGEQLHFAIIQWTRDDSVKHATILYSVNGEKQKLTFDWSNL